MHLNVGFPAVSLYLSTSHSTQNFIAKCRTFLPLFKGMQQLIGQALRYKPEGREF
jgi:hypothetical protein